MRRFLPLLAATVVLVGASTNGQIEAPSAEVFGNYTLVLVNGGELPYTFTEEDGTITAGSMVLREE